MGRTNKKGLYALAFGTLGLGMTEFVLMGILPYLAADLKISISTAGHFISAYAAGVCLGAPLLIFVGKQPLKRLLLLLVSISALGSIGTVFSSSYGMMLLARFVSGLPHGAYFGVASIVAKKLARQGQETKAVSIMIAGMTVANLLGVPLGTFLSIRISWRATFILTALWNLITLFYIYRWVPSVEGVKIASLRDQFRFLKSLAPWLLLLATMFGNGGIFCWYSYINPLLVHLAGFSKNSISIMMILAGIGMVAGNICGGRLSDYFSPGKTAALMQALAAIGLLMIFLFAENGTLAVLLMVICTFCLFAVSSPQQLLIINHSSGGELLGAACIQVAFNLGNALGAYFGGIPVGQGLGYQYPALMGFPMAILGALLLTGFVFRYEKNSSRQRKLFRPTKAQAS